MSASRKWAALLVPWMFLVVFAVLYARFLWPQLTSGHLVGALFGALVGLVFVSFAVAAVTFSRDVVSGRYL